MSRRLGGSMSSDSHTADLPRDAGEGLVLRRATAVDIPALVDLHREAYGDDPAGYRSEADEYQLSDLLERPHPTFSGSEMTVVEETATGRIVSSQHLSHHRWAYGGVEFPVGEIEHVSTRVEFRQRGLIRQQTDLMHLWSAAAGELATVVNGIPWYYTQFGYDLPLDKHNGRRLIRDYAVQGLAHHAPYAVREAGLDDLEFIQRVFQSSARRHLVSYVRTRSDWEYELAGRDERNAWARRLFILTSDTTPVGFISMAPNTLAVDAFEVDEGTPWSTATLSVARWLAHDASRALGHDDAERSTWSFGWLGETHPAFRACPQLFGHPETLGSPFRRGAWYVRVPDVPGFLAHVAPALEEALATSNEAGYTGTLRIGRYRQPGMVLHLDRGRIAVEGWEQPGIHDGDARFADATFTELLFGRTGLRELETLFPYRVGVSPTARPVLDALFPRRPSLLLPVY